MLLYSKLPSFIYGHARSEVSAGIENTLVAFGSKQFSMKMSCTDTFFCILFQSLIRIRDNKRKKDKRTTGEKNTKTQEDAMEVIMMRDNKITN